MDAIEGAPTRKLSGSFLQSILQNEPPRVTTQVVSNPAVIKAQSLHKTRSSPHKMTNVQEMLKSGMLPPSSRLHTAVAS